MNRLIAFLCLLWVSPVALAQVEDDFANGNFTSNPTWTGDAADFKVNSQGQLQLNTSGAGKSYLVTANALGDSARWEFWLKLTFPPSGNNYARVYLMSDEKDIKNNPVNGYFLQFGEPGPDDAIELVRQDGQSETVVCRGIDGQVASAFEMRVRVTRDHAGNWMIMTDPTGGHNFQVEATGHDHTYSNTSWFGFYCQYTMSNATGFYFDDIIVDHYAPNVHPPQLEYLTVLNQHELLLEFSEIITTASAQNVDNYFASPVPGNPLWAMQHADDARKITIRFHQPFVSALPCTLAINGVVDLAGNTMDTAMPFMYYDAQRGDIVINEIMANPNPTVGLPNANFLELYNRADHPISLHGWTLQAGNSLKDLSNITLQPDSFLILCREDEKDLFKPYGQVYGFSSLILANAGALLVLKNHRGQVIHHVDYKDTWYGDPQKNNGGWSLEQIDPNNFCAGMENWTASKALYGGTPASHNSVKDHQPDTNAPRISNVVVVDSMHLKVSYAKSMDSLAINDTAIYHIDQGMPAPVNVKNVPPAYRDVILRLEQPIQPNVVYTLTVQDTVVDCPGNAASGISFPFSLYVPRYQDVVISEVMCRPSGDKGLPDAVYLELKNRTPFPVHIGNWNLTYHSAYSSKSLSDQTILPDSFVIVCHERDLAEMAFYGPVSTVSSLILPNGGSELVLRDSLNRLITSVTYSDQWYKNDFKQDAGGWSLEMIDTDYPCVGYDNWRASKAPQGGTPGRTNSVDGPNPDTRSPRYVSTIYENPSVFIIELDKTMDPLSLPPVSSFEVKGLGPCVGIQLMEPCHTRLKLVLPAPLSPDNVYELVVTDTFSDCAGNVLERTVLPLAVPHAPKPGDVLINEILFEPPHGAADFVEIINNSGKPLYLFNMNLVFTDPRDLSATSEAEMDPHNRVLFDGDIWCFTKDQRGVAKTYKRSLMHRIFQVPQMPSLLSERGIVTLQNSWNGMVIDSVSYHRDMHSPMLKDTRGVSLERISPQLPSHQKDNWISAAETAGFATPGFQNSQYNATGTTYSGEMTLEYPVFAPNGDGYRDVLIVNYMMDNPGYIGNIRVFDRNGKEVRILKNNVLLETQGTFIWDGMTEQATKAPVGVYLVHMEVFDMQGNREDYRQAAVLGGRLD